MEAHVETQLETADDVTRYLQRHERKEILRFVTVGSVDEAIEHIERYSTGHSEAIVTESLPASEAFVRGISSACVYVNASTRFTDGAEFGMGAEIGNSTQKLHARGPIGLRELCAGKYLIEGDGHVRS